MKCEGHAEKTAIGTEVLRNLMTALKSLLQLPQPSELMSEPPTKRFKPEQSDEAPLFHDPFNIWVGQNEEPPPTEGAIFVQLTTAGLINALAGHPGGIVNAKGLFLDPTNTIDSFIPSAANISYKELRTHATALHHLAQTRLEADFLLTTPSI